MNYPNNKTVSINSKFSFSIVILFFLLLFGKQSKPQVTEIPQLTKKQMVEDFEYLIEIVKDVFPTAIANKKLYGINVFENLDNYKNKISEIQTTMEFITLVNQAINSCRGSHFWINMISANNFEKRQRKYWKGFTDKKSLAINEIYFKYLYGHFKDYKLNVPLFYYKNEYYTKYDFTYQNGFSPKGLKVIRCNGEKPKDIIKNNSNKIWQLSWDYDNHEFYIPTFYKYLNTENKTQLSFEFEDQEGHRIHTIFSLDQNVEIQKPTKDDSKTIQFLEKSKVLYIRIPSMTSRDTTFYIKNIKKESENKHIYAIIIDIRNNGGGSDIVWRKILRTLIHKEYQYELKIGIRNSELTLKYAKRHPSGKEIIKKGTIQQIPFLENEEYYVLSIKDKLKPSWRSIKFDGNIYVLSDNVYSAAGSLVTLAKQIDQIVSVGFRNPFILGLGIDPFSFSLPHSKFTFIIEPVIDLTNAVEAEEVFHTDVEIEIDPGVEELLQYYNYSDENVSLEDFLMNYDPFFKKVLNLHDN